MVREWNPTWNEPPLGCCSFFSCLYMYSRFMQSLRWSRLC